MKKTISYLIFTILLLNSSFIFSQSTKKEAIATAVSNYFTLERESIHAHFTKSVYFTNEKIWFKGYVFNRKLGIPFFNTTNVFAVLIDEKGTVVDTQLLYCNLSTFKGCFKLGSKVASGRYYVQFYTNWMNNFTEDESAVYELTVINPEKGIGNALAKADPSKINIEFYPEGGSLVSDVTNTVGIYVSDCNHEPMPVTFATVTDASGKNPITVQLTKQGYGRFILPAGIAAGSKAVVTYDGRQYEQALPAFQPNGIALEVNNYTIPDKTIVNIKAGKAWLTANGAKPVYLLLHKDGEMHVYDVNLNSTSEQKMVLANTDLSAGTNTIRVLDSDLNQLAERLVYKYTGDPLYATIDQNTMGYGGNGLTGKINKQGMNLSISVLPEKTRSGEEAEDMYSAFLILPYIKSHNKIIGKSYFNLLARPRAYETDLFMLCQKSKYDWNNIKNNPPKDKNPFDAGITIQGKLPQALMPVKDISFVRLYCGYPIIDRSIELKENGEYAFENMIITDSSFVNLSKLYKAEKPKEFFDVPIIVNGNRSFNKMYKPQPRCFIPGNNEDIAGLPNFLSKAITLDEVVVEGKKLRYANITGNSALRAFKITNDEVTSYRTLYNFLAYNSFFQVADVDGSVIIQTRSKSSFSGGQPTPLLYVDNMLMMDYDIVRTIYMEDIDEIYMDARAIVPSVRNNEGIIKVYLKRDVRIKKQSGANKVLIRHGFENIATFENVTYGSTSDEGFANFGLIGWEPFIVSDAGGNFNFKIPVTDQKTVRVLIEGFAADGTLISDVKTIRVK